MGFGIVSEANVKHRSQIDLKCDDYANVKNCWNLPGGMKLTDLQKVIKSVFKMSNCTYTRNTKSGEKYSIAITKCAQQQRIVTLE